MHALRVTERPPQDRLVDDRPPERGLCRAEAILAGHTGVDKFFYLLPGQLLLEAEQGVGVLPGLQQPWDDLRVVRLDDLCLRLEVHEPAELVRMRLAFGQLVQPVEVHVGAEGRVELGGQVGRWHQFGRLDPGQRALAGAEDLRQLHERQPRGLAVAALLRAEVVAGGVVRGELLRLERHRSRLSSRVS